MAKKIDFSQFHRVLAAERSEQLHLIPKSKPLFGVDAALCGARPLMLGWRAYKAGVDKVGPCEVCMKEAA